MSVALGLLVVLGGCSGESTAGNAAGGGERESADASLQEPLRALPDGHSAASWHQLREVDPDVRLIAVPPASAGRAFEFDGLTVWPTAEEFRTMAPAGERSAEFPAIYDGGSLGADDVLPVRAGAVQPADALKEAEKWIRRVLKDEYVPITLAARLKPLAHPRAEFSTIWVRYQMGGVSIQVGQTRSSMVIVLHSATYVGELSAEFGREAFRRFLKDQALAHAEMQPAPSADALLAMFHVRSRGFSWFDRSRWYTDGRAVAIYLPKRLPGDEQVSADTPWF